MNNPHYGGGGASVIGELAQRLGKSHSVMVLSGSFPGWRQHPRPSYSKRYLRVGWAGPRAGQALYHLLLPLYARFLNYDLWIESCTPPVSVSFLPLASRGRRVLAMVQSLAAEDASARYRLPFVAVEQRGLKVYSDFVVLNPVDRAIIGKANPTARCEIVRNGITLPPHPGSFGQGEYVLFLGRIDIRQKGLDLLVQAFDLSKTNMPMVIAGSGTPAEERRLHEALAVGNRPVSFVGHVAGSAKEALLKNAAFVVLPSRHETFGMSALEAMAYGRPVVHFDLPRLEWIPESAGIKVPAYDVSALAEAIDALTEDKPLRAQLGEAGRAASEAYDWSQVGPELLEAIERLVLRTD